jgi:hypothetical protein
MAKRNDRVCVPDNPATDYENCAKERMNNESKHSTF